MNYARRKLLNKQLPAYAGLFVLLVTLGTTILLSRNTIISVSNAAVGSEPKNIEVSNITNASFTVSFTTDVPTVGTVSYGASATSLILALDTRDEAAGIAAEHQVHFITIKNLNAGTEYYYVINTGSTKTENSGSPFTITTASLPPKQTSLPTLLGTVANSDGSIPAEGIIYATTSGSQQFAALINPDGTYQLPLNSLLNTSLNSYAAFTPTTALQLQAVTPTEQSTVQLLASQATQVPKILLGQNYDFTQASPTPSASATPGAGPGFPVNESTTPVTSPVITTPQVSQAFKDQQPLFQGRALANTQVSITIQSAQEIATQVQSDSNGNWQFRPTTPLAPGNHTITISSLNASGIMQSISRTFTVYASGSQFTAPSISPGPTSVLLTAIPTIAVTPTSVPSPTPTPDPTPTVMQNLSVAPTKTPIPKTGSSVLETGIIAGISAMGIGALLFILSAI